MTITGIQVRCSTRKLDSGRGRSQSVNPETTNAQNSTRHALVPVQPVDAGERHDAPANENARPQIFRASDFLAHLVATREHAPQTRSRNRAEPADAINAYRTAMQLNANDVRGVTRAPTSYKI